MTASFVSARLEVPLEAENYSRVFASSPLVRVKGLCISNYGAADSSPIQNALEKSARASTVHSPATPVIDSSDSNFSM